MDVGGHSLAHLRNEMRGRNRTSQARAGWNGRDLRPAPIAAD